MSDNSLPEPDQELPKQKKLGRPSSYTKELDEEICDRIAKGETLRTIIKDDHMPDRISIYRWLEVNEEFRDRYAHARLQQADNYFEQIVDEAFSSHDAQIGRLRIDALKWVASKMQPKKYGDKLEIETKGDSAIAIQFAIPERKPEAIELESGKLPAPHEDRV
jgi:hypothetical protein